MRSLRDLGTDRNTFIVSILLAVYIFAYQIARINLDVPGRVPRLVQAFSMLCLLGYAMFFETKPKKSTVFIFVPISVILLYCAYVSRLTDIFYFVIILFAVRKTKIDEVFKACLIFTTRYLADS